MNTSRNHLMVFWGIIFFVCYAFSVAHTQVISNARIPHVFPHAAAGDVYLDHNNRVHILGLGDSISYSFFDDVNGLNTIYYTVRDSSSYSVVDLIPEIAPYHYYYGFEMDRFRFAYDVVTDGNSNLFVTWDRQQEHASDILPPYWYRPSLACFMRAGSAWQQIFREPDGKNPRAVAGHDNSIHFVWESVATNRPDTNYFFYVAQVVYRARSSSGVLSTPIVIDTGFAPQILLDRNNAVHIFYLRADSISSGTFALMYAKSTVGGFTSPIVLRERILSENHYGFDWKPKDVSVSVDQQGQVHAAWRELRTTPNFKFFSLRYDGSTVSIDSSLAYYSYNAVFTFEADGTVHATWDTEDGSGNETLLYSSSRGATLFSSIRTFHSMAYVGGLNVVLNSRGAANAIFADNGGIKLLKDLAAGTDTLVTLAASASAFTNSDHPVTIDASDNIWLSYYARCSDTTCAYEPWLLQYKDGPLSVDQTDEVAGGFALEQNYPNPFNPVTNFQFSIGNSRLAILKVYDVLGREVATLVDEVKEPGTHAVTWDASGFSSGVYFYRLRSGGFTQTRRLLLLR